MLFFLCRCSFKPFHEAYDSLMVVIAVHKETSKKTSKEKKVSSPHSPSFTPSQSILR